MTMNRRTLATTAALSTIVVLAIALTALWGQQRTSPTLDSRTAAVASQLRCPICQGESVNDSPSALSQDMRRIIRRRLAAGQTPDQIKAYFVSKYGQWILLSPPSKGIGAFIWLAPILLLALGLIALALLTRRWRTTRSPPTRTFTLGHSAQNSERGTLNVERGTSV